MPRLEWNESFSVNVSEIDEQHHRWIDLINKLHDAIMDKKISSKTTDKILSEMIDYTHFHFTFEEEYMKKINYPDLQKHHYQHEFFTKNIIGKLQEERAGGLVLSSEVMRMMMNWLQEHILQEDMKYGPE